MRNDEPRGRNGGVFSARSLSSYMRFVSSGASTAASTIRSASASIVSTIANNPSDDSTRDQVHWAGFDKLELDSTSNSNSLRQVLLLAYKSGFQIWDVEKSDDVRQLASRHDGPISFLQVQKNPNPNSPNKTLDRFSDSRPLLIVACEDNVNNNGDYDPNSEDGLFPSFVKFYSLKLHDYVHTLKFRSSVHAIRCSPRVVCVSQTSQIHCFNASTLEREYTILTYPISFSPAGAGYGPLAVGPRWIAYSGNPVAFCDAGRVTPQILNNNNNNNNNPVDNNINNNNGGNSLSNTSLVAHYAKESGRQLANGITTLGDIGFQKLSKYYSFNGHNNNNIISNNHNGIMNKSNSFVSRSNTDSDNAGTVIVRDIVSKQVIVQFRAHTSHISALCFDPSGTLLVTASIHGRNINVFRIMPPVTNSDASGSGSYLHLYRLQRGLTNAVIKDISFSDDSEWIMISSSRGTSHLFAISPYLNNNNVLITDGGAHSQGLHKKSLSAPGPPVTLSVVSRIRNGSNGLIGSNGLNGLKGVVSIATGGGNNAISGAVASAFYKYNNNNNNNNYKNNDNNLGKDYLLVFSPSGSIIQYLLHRANQYDSVYDHNNIINNNVNNNINSNVNNNNNRFVVEALQKWDVCHKRNRRDNGEIFDIYGDQDNNNINNNNININNNKSINNNKYSNEESRHLYYISEIELQTHIVEKPLWAKSQICFQVMSKYDNNNNNNNNGGGEIMIELNATRSIEARSKYLIPVFDSLRTNRVNIMNRLGSQSLDYNNLSSDDMAPFNGSIVNNMNGHGQFVNRNNSGGGDQVSEARLQFNNVNNINNNNNNGGVVEASGFLPDLL